MTDSISFSFVLPAFKSEYLKKSIDSILAQTYPDFELIIVNDASPHPIDKIVASYQSDKIRYYKNPHNIGGADLVKNWNHCLHYAKGEYVILASDDDIYEKDFLLTASRIVMKHPTVDVVRSRVVKIDESDLIIEQEYPLDEILTAAQYAYFWSKPEGIIDCVANFVFKKEALLSHDGFVNFPCAHYSDCATALLMSENGISCISESLFSFRVSSINLSNASEYTTARKQLLATQEFSRWFKDWINKLPVGMETTAALVYFRRRYIHMLDNLFSKFPLSKIIFIAKEIFHDNLLYKKEKTLMLLKFLQSKF